MRFRPLLMPRDSLSSWVLASPAGRGWDRRPLADIPDGVDEKTGKPKFTWKPYSETPATLEHVRGWFTNGRASIGLATGCGDAECFEFDDRDVYDNFLDAAAAAGLGDLVDRIRTGYEEFTPGGGVHWIYRCSEHRGNAKLAERPDPNDPNKREPLIETRGAGGFIIIAPYAGKVHPTGGAYVRVNGGLGLMTVLWPEERDALWRFAQSFDEMPEQPQGEPEPPKRQSGMKRRFPLVSPKPVSSRAMISRPGNPGEHPRASWVGQALHARGGDLLAATRQGSCLASATTGHCKGLKVFSSSTPFSIGDTHQIRRLRDSRASGPLRRQLPRRGPRRVWNLD